MRRHVSGNRQSPGRVPVALRGVDPPSTRRALGLQAAIGNRSTARVLQRWKSASLSHDTDYMRLRGIALFYAQQEQAEDIDEYSDDDELAEFLPPRERTLLLALGKATSMKFTTLHHVLSRNKIEQLVKLMNVEQRKRVLEKLARPGDQGVTQVLQNLRSNLILGPDGAKRSDDPARRKGDSDFDPGYAESGELDELSKIYAEADAIISQLKGPDDAPRVDAVLDLFEKAEDLHAASQNARRGESTIRLDFDSKWIGEGLGSAGASWRKRQGAADQPAVLAH